MRHSQVWAVGIVLVGAVVGIARTGATAGEGFRIAPQRAHVAPGGSAQFRISPPPEKRPGALRANERLGWLVSGPGTIRDGLYLAPYIVPHPGLTIDVLLVHGSKTRVDTVTATVDLAPGTYPGADACLGAGQSWAASGRGLDYVFLEELPEAITRVTPEYPPSAKARDLRGTLVVNAIVCRNGRVLDAEAQWGVGATLIAELEELAVAAARQWVFKPAAAGGQTVATTVAIPFTFPPP